MCLAARSRASISRLSSPMPSSASSLGRCGSYGKHVRSPLCTPVFCPPLSIGRTLHGNNVEPKKAVPPHLARVEPISESRVLVSDGKAPPTPAPHSASDSRLTVIEPCLPPRCAEIVRTIVSGWPRAPLTRECETSCLTWRAHGRGWL